MLYFSVLWMLKYNHTIITKSQWSGFTGVVNFSVSSNCCNRNSSVVALDQVSYLRTRTPQQLLLGHQHHHHHHHHHHPNHHHRRLHHQVGQVGWPAYQLHLAGTEAVHTIYFLFHLYNSTSTNTCTTAPASRSSRSGVALAQAFSSCTCTTAIDQVNN